MLWLIATRIESFRCEFWRQMVSQMLPRSELKGSQITHLDWIEGSSGDNYLKSKHLPWCYDHNTIGFYEYITSTVGAAEHSQSEMVYIVTRRAKLQVTTLGKNFYTIGHVGRNYGLCLLRGHGLRTHKESFFSKHIELLVTFDPGSYWIKVVKSRI